MKFKALPVIITAALTSVGTLMIANKLEKNATYADMANQAPVNYVHYNGNTPATATSPIDFQPAAEASIKAVVHITTKQNAKAVVAQDPAFGDDFFGQLFGRRQYYIPPKVGSGSGVVMSPDGYIVTNNHVVSGADVVTVTFDNKFTTDAKIVGRDASSDIAVIKIDEKNLPYMEFGNSDDVKVGQWVLAVGYPLTLDATVTAGIVSAKGRSIGINQRQSATAIESFIQTDAAVNPGNSGGALVNTSGQLVGINSAIASPTGSYAGYSYAIPANIVKKVAEDIIKYGTVQRGYLGINYIDRKMLSQDELNTMGIDRTEGVYVEKVITGSGADQAGIKHGDLIIKVNGVSIKTSPDLLAQIALYKPGDNISITYIRDKKEKNVSVQLKDLDGNTDVITKTAKTKLLGANMRELSKTEVSKYKVSGGVLVDNVGNGVLRDYTDMRNGFVITDINGTDVQTLAQVQDIFNANSNNLKIGGFYPGKEGRYYYGVRLKESMSEREY